MGKKLLSLSNEKWPQETGFSSKAKCGRYSKKRLAMQNTDQAALPRLYQKGLESQRSVRKEIRLGDGQRHTGIRVLVIWNVLGSYVVMKGHDGVSLMIPNAGQVRLRVCGREGEGLLARNMTRLPRVIILQEHFLLCGCPSGSVQKGKITMTSEKSSLKSLKQRGIMASFKQLFFSPCGRQFSLATCWVYLG